MSPLARRVARLEQRREGSVADANAMHELARACFLEKRELPATLTRAEHDLASAVLDMLDRSRNDRWAPGTLPLQALPRGY